MAVISIKLIEYEEGIDGSKPTIRKKYRVQTDALATASLDARMGVAALPVETSYLITRLMGKPLSDPRWVEVDLGLESAPFDQDQDPLLRPSIMNGSYSEFQENYFKDSDGTLVLTSAYERFETYLQRFNGKPILQVTKNMPTYPLVTYDTLKYTTNADVVVIGGTTYAANTLLFLPPTAQEIYEKQAFTTYHYFGTTFRVAADHDLHRDKVEDRGYWERGVLFDQSRILIGAERVSPKTPYPLDGSGHAKASAGDAPAILTFKPYGSQSWGIDFS